jgi:hypothetical protein
MLPPSLRDFAGDRQVMPRPHRRDGWPWAARQGEHPGVHAARVSKAQLAQLMGTQPAAMRRLCGLALVPKSFPAKASRARKGIPVAATA